jgi:hypothetical protein
VARAAPEARASGNIRPRGAAHDLGASRRSTPFAYRGEKIRAVLADDSGALAPRERFSISSLPDLIRQSMLT